MKLTIEIDDGYRLDLAAVARRLENLSWNAEVSEEQLAKAAAEVFTWACEQGGMYEAARRDR